MNGVEGFRGGERPRCAGVARGRAIGSEPGCIAGVGKVRPSQPVTPVTVKFTAPVGSEPAPVTVAR